VTSNWDTSESRPRKYYVLSEFGSEIFAQLKEEWQNNTRELSTLLEGGEEE